MCAANPKRTRAEILVSIRAVQPDWNHVRQVEIGFLVNEPARAEVDRISTFTLLTRNRTVLRRSLSRIDHHTGELIDHHPWIGDHLFAVVGYRSLAINVPTLFRRVVIPEIDSTSRPLVRVVGI